jgi:xanthine/CO dehydrogenase XdhC/CoxF family maturation factor
MLIAQDRWIAGCVSGGCLEGDVVRRGEYRLRRGVPVVVTYDSTSNDDSGWGMGLGCNGVVEVLLERVQPGDGLDPLLLASDCFAARQRCALATVFRSDEPAIPVGARVVVQERGGATVDSLPEGAVRDNLEAAARAALDHAGDGRADATTVMISRVTALIEVMVPPPRLFVCGGGHDAVPVVALARAMGWRTTVVVATSSIATRERFAAADSIIAGPADVLLTALRDHREPFAVVMSHDYERDRACLGALLRSCARYIGVLGPRQRTERMLAELSYGGPPVVDDILARLHAPIGLDLGSETPIEVALAIVAEVQAAMTSTTGRRLRERVGPIHAVPRGASATPLAGATSSATAAEGERG